MDLATTLADALCEAHPIDAARVLEGIGVDEAALALQRMSRPAAASVLQRVSPLRATALLAALEGGVAAEIAERLGSDLAAAGLRAMPDAARERLLNALPAQTARALRRLLSFSEGTAGALADSNVLSLPQDVTVRDALARVREASDAAYYNVYVLDRETDALVGVLNLRELLLARRGQRLDVIMKRNVVRLAASAGRRDILTHPAWREYRSIPVVDPSGRFVGAVRYRTLRRLEQELRGPDAASQPLTAEALGELFRAGIGGVLDALSPAAAPKGGTNAG
jgi:magnesium transporter